MPDRAPDPGAKYRTIVADPPWHYDVIAAAGMRWGKTQGSTLTDPKGPAQRLPYKTMSVAAIKDLPVDRLAETDAHLFLWTTNRYLQAAYDVVDAWKFAPSQVLVWCKPVHGHALGGLFASTTEFVLYCRRGSPAHITRSATSWWLWAARVARSFTQAGGVPRHGRGRLPRSPLGDVRAAPTLGLGHLGQRSPQPRQHRGERVTGAMSILHSSPRGRPWWRSVTSRCQAPRGEISSYPAAILNVSQNANQEGNA